MSDPKPGDTVRISHEGVVRSVSSDHPVGGLFVDLEFPDGGKGTLRVCPESNAKLEVIREAYVDGWLYIDVENEVLKYTATGNDGGPGWFSTNRYTESGWSYHANDPEYAALPVKRLDGPISERPANG